jgi:hypothetical protein
METNIIAKEIFLERMTKRKITLIKNGRNFMVNKNLINVRGCDVNNKWAVNTGPGWDRINPLKFDYVVCVAFDKNSLNANQCYIFSKDELPEFPDSKWKGATGLKNIMLRQKDLKLKVLVEDSKENWNKIVGL